MAHQNSDLERFVAKLRLEHIDNGDPSRMDMLRERQEAANLIEALSNALCKAESACDKALTGMARWQSGKPFDATGPEAGIKDQLYDVIRPNARDSIKKLYVLLDTSMKG